MIKFGGPGLRHRSCIYRVCCELKRGKAAALRMARKKKKRQAAAEGEEAFPFDTEAAAAARRAAEEHAEQQCAAIQDARVWSKVTSKLLRKVGIDDGLEDADYDDKGGLIDPTMGDGGDEDSTKIGGRSHRSTFDDSGVD